MVHLIPARSRPGVGDSQPDPLGLLLPPVRSRPGVDEFSLGMSPIPVGFRYFLHEIGPMTRNPERDTERSRVVRARNPSLLVTHTMQHSFLSRHPDEYHFREACDMLLEIPSPSLDT